jgi:hypothetical protein
MGYLGMVGIADRWGCKASEIEGIQSLSIGQNDVKRVLERSEESKEGRDRVSSIMINASGLGKFDSVDSYYRGVANSGEIRNGKGELSMAGLAV